TGLPIPATSFIGRRTELHATAAALRDARVVTLLGPGGVGKTRLAIEAARSLDDYAEDSAWLIDLTAAADPDRVLPAVADTLGAAGHDLDSVARRLADRPTLLVVDNAEHLVGAVAATVAGILARAPLAAVLVTSREPLRLPGEKLLPVEPLPPAAARDVFLERAREARREALPPAEERLVDDICAALDGIPLALELSAARLDDIAAPDLLDALRADAPRPGASVEGGRHASVENAVQWSIDLLTSSQRDLLIQLGRFAGGFPQEAVLGICDCDDDIEAVLTRLVDKSLVAVSYGNAGERRYRLLDTVRRSVRALDADEPEWWRRHRHWLTGFAARTGAATLTHDAPLANALLDLLRADLRVALDGAIADGDRLTAVTLAGSQAHHWFRRGLLFDGLASIDRALAVPGELPPLLEAQTLLGLMVLTYQTGHAERTLAELERAYELGAAAGDPTVQTVALARTAYARSLFGAVDVARESMARAAEHAEHAAPWGKAELLMCRGQMLRALGDYAAAAADLRQSFRLAEQVGYQWMASSARYVLGKVLTDQGDGLAAIAELREATLAIHAAEDAASTLAGMHQIGAACALVDRHADGARIFGAVDRIGVRYGYNPVLAEGEDTRRLRDRVAAGLPGGGYERAYAEGAPLEFADLFALVETLPRAER
ncbi:MAG TPA: AAA family ATPase, partial [Naasia sp.]